MRVRALSDIMDKRLGLVKQAGPRPSERDAVKGIWKDPNNVQRVQESIKMNSDPESYGKTDWAKVIGQTAGDTLNEAFGPLYRAVRDSIRDPMIPVNTLADTVNDIAVKPLRAVGNIAANGIYNYGLNGSAGPAGMFSNYFGEGVDPYEGPFGRPDLSRLNDAIVSQPIALDAVGKTMANGVDRTVEAVHNIGKDPTDPNFWDASRQTSADRAAAHQRFRENMYTRPESLEELKPIEDMSALAYETALLSKMPSLGMSGKYQFVNNAVNTLPAAATDYLFTSGMMPYYSNQYDTVTDEKKPNPSVLQDPELVRRLAQARLPFAFVPGAAERFPWIGSYLNGHFFGDAVGNYARGDDMLRSFESTDSAFAKDYFSTQGDLDTAKYVYSVTQDPRQKEEAAREIYECQKKLKELEQKQIAARIWAEQLYGEANNEAAMAGMFEVAGPWMAEHPGKTLGLAALINRLRRIPLYRPPEDAVPGTTTRFIGR